MLENGHTEFKEKYSDTLVKTLVAFSNTRGGRIMIGVDDEGKILGVDDPDDVAKRCVNVITDKVRPDMTMNAIVEVEQLDGKNVVTISVHEGNEKPYYLREEGLRAEGVYVREGTSSVPVTEERFQQMIQNVRSVAFEEQESFIQNLTFATLKAAFLEKSLKLTEANMESLHIMEKGRFTQLGFILSDQFDQSIKIAAYNDEYRMEFLERAEYSGSVIKQMNDVLAFIARYNNPSSIISGMKRVDRYAYPERSVREAVVNAIVHRDYSVGDATLISIYRTKITIVSPGSLNRNYTMEELLTGVSSLRNKNLANIFYRLDYIESYGTGIPRIFGLYRGTYTHPEITVGGSTFTITLPSMNVAEDPAQPFIDGRNEFTRADLEKEMGVSRSEAVSIINRLLEGERIIKIGAGRAIRYRPNRPLYPLEKSDDPANLRV